MKVTLRQLKRIIESSFDEKEDEKNRNSDDDFFPLTVTDEDSKVKAVLSLSSSGNLKLVINDREYSDPKKIAAVVTKAYLDLPAYISNNPDDKDYRQNLNKIINKTIDNGVEGLKDTKQNRLVVWNSIVQKLGRGKDRNS